MILFVILWSPKHESFGYQDWVTVSNSSLELQIKSSLLWKFSLEIEGEQTGVRLSACLYYMYTLLPALSHMDLCQRYVARALIYALKSFWKASFTWVVQWHRLVILPVVIRLHKKIVMLLWVVNAYCYFPNCISELTFNIFMKYFEWSILHLHNYMPINKNVVECACLSNNLLY